MDDSMAAASTYQVCGAISNGFAGDRIGLLGNRICDSWAGHDGEHSEVLRGQQALVLWADGQPAEWEINRLRAALEAAHTAMDDLNARLGSQWHLCRFCTAATYDGRQGVEHDDGCAIRALRDALKATAGGTG